MAWTRPALGGNSLATILCPNHRPQIGTVRPGVFKKGERDDARQAEIIHEDIHITADRIRTRLVEVIHEMGSGKRGPGGAPRLLCPAAAGVVEPEDCALRNWPTWLEASWGVAQQWTPARLPTPTQVGQTSKTVGPQGVYCLRHIRGHPACGGDERFRHHLGNQQGLEALDLQIA